MDIEDKLINHFYDRLTLASFWDEFTEQDITNMYHAISMYRDNVRIEILGIEKLPFFNAWYTFNTLVRWQEELKKDVVRYRDEEGNYSNIYHRIFKTEELITATSNKLLGLILRQLELEDNG